RMQSSVPKQYLMVNGKTVLQLTLERLGNLPIFARIVVVLADGDSQWPAVLARLDAQLREKVLIVAGGHERFHSVSNALTALQAIAEPQDWVLVHDAV